MESKPIGRVIKVWSIYYLVGQSCCIKNLCKGIEICCRFSNCDLLMFFLIFFVHIYNIYIDKSGILLCLQNVGFLIVLFNFFFGLSPITDFCFFGQSLFRFLISDSQIKQKMRLLPYNFHHYVYYDFLVSFSDGFLGVRKKI